MTSDTLELLNAMSGLGHCLRILQMNKHYVEPMAGSACAHIEAAITALNIIVQDLIEKER